MVGGRFELLKRVVVTKYDEVFPRGEVEVDETRPEKGVREVVGVTETAEEGVREVVGVTEKRTEEGVREVVGVTETAEEGVREVVETGIEEGVRE